MTLLLIYTNSDMIEEHLENDDKKEHKEVVREIKHKMKVLKEAIKYER